MMKVKGIFAVSFIAMMVVGGAYANIASQGYVDQQIGTRQVAGDYATNTALGNVRTTATNAQSAAANAQKTADAKVSTAQGPSAANKAVITNASGNITTGTISSAMITDGTITNADIATSAAIAQSKISGLTTALAGKANTADVPTKTSDLANDSGFITSADLPEEYELKAATASALGGVKSGGDITVATSGAVTVNSATKADSATTAASATKATQDASGNVITSTYAKKTDLNAKQNASTAVEVATAGTAVGDSTHPVYVNASGVATKIDKVAAAAKADTATSATSATNATNATNDADGNDITETYATKTEVGSKLSSISGSTGGTGNVVTSVSASGSTVSATKGITAEETKNKVKSVRAAASATDTAYPSEKAVATALAAKADASALSGYATNTRVDAVEDKAEAAQTAASAAQSTATAAQNAANTKVTTAQGSSAANKAVITNSSGNIITGQIATGMIANDAVTSAKLAAGAVDATALASNAVTSAKIADGTIVNADISASAAIAASKISGLATVAKTGAYGDLSGAPTVHNATLTIQKNGTSAGTFTANASANRTINITVPTKTSELTNDSNYATTAQVNARVATAQGTDNANDVMVVNSSGNVTPALITNANISSSAAIAQSKISGLTTALAGKLSTTGTAAKATADAKGNNIADTYATKAQITALDSTSSGTGAVVTDVSQTDGKVSVTKGNVQIPVGSANATTYATIWVQ